MALSVYQKIKFSDCSWKDDVHGSEPHYLYMHYEPTFDVTHIKDESGETIICGEDSGVIEALRELLNFKGEDITKEEYNKI